MSAYRISKKRQLLRESLGNSTDDGSLAPMVCMCVCMFLCNDNKVQQDVRQNELLFLRSTIACCLRRLKDESFRVLQPLLEVCVVVVCVYVCNAIDIVFLAFVFSNGLVKNWNRRHVMAFDCKIIKRLDVVVIC